MTNYLLKLVSKHKRLTDAYRFPGSTPFQTVKGIVGDSKARLIMLKRNQTKRFLVILVAMALLVLMIADLSHAQTGLTTLKIQTLQATRQE